MLPTRVDDILKRTGCPKVDIVAHSLGGLVARYYMTMGLGPGKVRRLITPEPPIVEPMPLYF